MRKVKVLLFAADPRLGRPGGIPLELAEELREIQYHVKQARYGYRLHLEAHGAARADDLIDLLEHTDAHVVHFSGHGGNAGIVLAGRGGDSPHPVNAEALQRLFHTYRGPVRLVVLSACSSHEEARAVAKIVGCAIGTPSQISDSAAITFNSRFYRAIANGYSVQRAFDDARTVLQVHNVPREEHPELFHRKDVDPANLVLVKTYRPVPHRLAAAAVACVLTFAAIVTDLFGKEVLPELTTSDLACGAQPASPGIRSLDGEAGGANAPTPAAPEGPGAVLANAKALYRARNYSAAADAFEAAAGDGNGEAMGCLGYMFLKGRGRDSQPATGIEWLRQAAREERDPHAMYALAMAYLSGDGVEPAEHLAEYWLREAAQKKGYAEAMRGLGTLYQQRMNDSSYHQALIWYRKAVDAGSLDARVDLGMMYEFGWGLARDGAAALEWYSSAARAGSPRGMLAVGKSYQKGVGTGWNYKRAMLWYRRAARAGSADAMNSIGVLYENGLGVRKSHARAVRWYRRAAEAGSLLARSNLTARRRD